MIRAMNREDLPAVIEVVNSTGLFPGEMLNGMASEALDGKSETERWYVLEDGHPIGVVYFAPERMTEGTWNLYLIAIHADRQGTGEGSKLIAHVERKLADEGHRILLVETSGNREFEQTRQFYRNNGYTEEARIREFYTTGEDKIVFWKKLGK
ncbi:MAG: GNAT family N-acetyltransferase [Pseudomonadota bacterium]